jgi:hypothetical protein
MVSGYCSRCRREIGGFLKPPLWQCPLCRKIWCDTCPKRKIGRIWKKFLCPECFIEMREGGLVTIIQALRED